MYKFVFSPNCYADSYDVVSGTLEQCLAAMKKAEQSDCENFSDDGGLTHYCSSPTAPCRHTYNAVIDEDCNVIAGAAFALGANGRSF